MDINIDEARKELSNLSLNTKRYLADRLGNQIISIKLTNEILSLDPSKKRDRIGEAIRNFFKEVNICNLFS